MDCRRTVIRRIKEMSRWFSVDLLQYILIQMIVEEHILLILSIVLRIESWEERWQVPREPRVEPTDGLRSSQNKGQKDKWRELLGAMSTRVYMKTLDRKGLAMSRKTEGSRKINGNTDKKCRGLLGAMSTRVYMKTWRYESGKGLAMSNVRQDVSWVNLKGTMHVNLHR